MRPVCAKPNYLDCPAIIKRPRYGAANLDNHDKFVSIIGRNSALVPYCVPMMAMKSINKSVRFPPLDWSSDQ